MRRTKRQRRWANGTVAGQTITPAPPRGAATPLQRFHRSSVVETALRWSSLPRPSHRIAPFRRDHSSLSGVRGIRHTGERPGSRLGRSTTAGRACRDPVSIAPSTTTGRNHTCFRQITRKHVAIPTPDSDRAIGNPPKRKEERGSRQIRPTVGAVRRSRVKPGTTRPTSWLNRSKPLANCGYRQIRPTVGALRRSRSSPGRRVRPAG